MTAPTAVEALQGGDTALRLEREIRHQVFRPRPRLSLSQWADRYGMLPRSTSAEPGQWRTDRAPYQRGIMDAITDPRTQRVCWIAPSQSGKTAIVLKAIGYYIDQDPATMLVVQPSLEFAREFSRDRLAPEIAATPILAAKVKKSGGRRDSSDTLLRKEYPGGYVTLVGANSATGLSSRPIRVVLLDEIDKYPPSAGDKGDPISLAINRTRTFWNRKIVLISTPGVRGVSRIEKEWNESDQRRFYVPCPHCGHLQHLRWAQLVFDDAAYACESCAALIPESKKGWMLERGQWVTERPEGTFPGFHLNALYSPWTTWKELVGKFLVAKKARETLQVFVNEELAELWDPDDGEAIDAEGLAARREQYRAEVPAMAGVLTAGVDVQGDRVELVVKAWGAGQESWLVAHHRVYGDPLQPDVWDRLDRLLVKGYQHEAGATLHITACCVDSGDGKTVPAVYRFVAPRQKRGVYATKGSSIRGKPIVSRPARRNKYGVKVVPLGSDTAKDVVFARLRSTTPGPGYLHFPRPQPDGADDEYLQQFSAERVLIKHHKGVPVREYQQVRDRNEAIDLEVLALAALHLLGAGVYDQLGTWVARVQSDGARAKAQTPPVATPAPDAPVSASLPVPRVMPRPRFGGSGYISKFRR